MDDINLFIIYRTVVTANVSYEMKNIWGDNN